jgi:hypothetical protein
VIALIGWVKEMKPNFYYLLVICRGVTFFNE